MLASAPAALGVPGATADAPPAGSFIDPGEGDDVAVGETVTPTVQASDDFGVRSVVMTLDGAPFATDTVAPYEQTWTPTYADIGATHTFVATITDSAQQSVTVTLHVDVPVPAGYAAATLGPPSWDAGTVLVGYESTRSFTLTNSGQNPVAVQSIGLTGDASFSIVPAPNVCMAPSTLAVGASCTILVRFAPTGEGARTGALSVGCTAPGDDCPLVAALTGSGQIFSTTVPGTVAGTVPPTLGLTISSAESSFGAFLPGVAADYTTSVALGVTHSSGGAMLTVQDPSSLATGHLVNGEFSLVVAAARPRRELAVRADRIEREPARAAELPGAGRRRPGRGDVQAADHRHRAAADRQLREDRGVHALVDSAMTMAPRDPHARVAPSLRAGAVARGERVGRPGRAVGVPRAGRPGARQRSR